MKEIGLRLGWKGSGLSYKVGFTSHGAYPHESTPKNDPARLL